MTKEKAESIDCITFYNIISEYYDKQLTEHDCDLFEKHFASCNLCNNFFHSFLETMKLVEGPIKSKYTNIVMPVEVQEKMANFLIDRQKRNIN